MEIILLHKLRCLVHIFESTNMPPEPTHKPRPNPTKPYNRKPKDSSKTASLTNQPRTSAKPPVHAANTKENLTLGDWLVVFGWIDAETKRRGGKVPQREIVEYFKNRREGALIFDQSTLSRNMKNRAALEQRATATANALSMKRARIVTKPKVECASKYGK
ncbi:hypothetical protein BJ165DRAFT_1481421 [Panaeolus papilionaceus]|nr:hypothetical protein BJ165DRAFT_1481421 [Panaeolus papilionaceus]